MRLLVGVMSEVLGRVVGSVIPIRHEIKYYIWRFVLLAVDASRPGYRGTIRTKRTRSTQCVQQMLLSEMMGEETKGQRWGRPSTQEAARVGANLPEAAATVGAYLVK